MKVDVYGWEDDNGDTHQCIYIDGEEERYVRPLWDCPEDAVIGRDLMGCKELYLFLKRGYESSQKGETLEYEYHNERPKDF